MCDLPRLGMCWLDLLSLGTIYVTFNLGLLLPLTEAGSQSHAAVAWTIFGANVAVLAVFAIVIGVFVGVAFLEERLSIAAVVGGLFVALGCAMALRGKAGHGA